jgi:hypothetical protein
MAVGDPGGVHDLREREAYKQAHCPAEGDGHGLVPEAHAEDRHVVLAEQLEREANVLLSAELQGLVAHGGMVRPARPGGEDHAVSVGEHVALERRPGVSCRQEIVAHQSYLSLLMTTTLRRTSASE